MRGCRPLAVVPVDLGDRDRSVAGFDDHSCGLRVDHQGGDRLGDLVRLFLRVRRRRVPAGAGRREWDEGECRQGDQGS
jgi:hypothetical protein